MTLKVRVKFHVEVHPGPANRILMKKQKAFIGQVILTQTKIVHVEAE
jgi:hypothetical protein